jgi:hypothetical protein
MPSRGQNLTAGRRQAREQARQGGNDWSSTKSPGNKSDA